jgi:hypothetical protein
MNIGYMAFKIIQNKKGIHFLISDSEAEVLGHI